jgi:hypothetical protein
VPWSKRLSCKFHNIVNAGNVRRLSTVHICCLVEYVHSTVCLGVGWNESKSLNSCFLVDVKDLLEIGCLGPSVKMSS